MTKILGIDGGGGVSVKKNKACNEHKVRGKVMNELKPGKV